MVWPMGPSQARLSFLKVMSPGDVVPPSCCCYLGRRDSKTFPRLADPLGYVDKEDIFHAIKAIVAAQRDYGRRDDRKQARLKYLVQVGGEGVGGGGWGQGGVGGGVYVLKGAGGGKAGYSAEVPGAGGWAGSGGRGVLVFVRRSRGAGVGRVWRERGGEGAGVVRGGRGRGPLVGGGT